MTIGTTSAGMVLWGAFFGLEISITIHIEQILELLAYINNTFSWDLGDNMLFYGPCNTSLPA